MPNEKRQMNGLTALMYAAMSGNVYCVHILLDAGADVNAVHKSEYDEEYHTIVRSTYAIRSGNIEVLDLLLAAGADADGLEEGLITVATEGNHVFLRHLIELGADVNLDKGLFWATRNGHHRCVRCLIEAGSDVNVQEGAALLVSAEGGHEKCLNQLIRAGADVNQCYLHDANSKAIKRLLCAGIIINQIKHDETALTRCIDSLHYSYGYSDDDEKRSKIMLLHTVGETVVRPPWSKSTELPDFLNYQTEELNLMSICRESIRKHLLQMSQVNLFYRMKKLHLPEVLCKYLLYNMEIKDDDDDGDDAAAADDDDEEEDD